MSAPPQAIVPNPHTNLLNVYILIANKMGFQQKKMCSNRYRTLPFQLVPDFVDTCTMRLKYFEILHHIQSGSSICLGTSF
jgi:hypothetical protein